MLLRAAHGARLGLDSARLPLLSMQRTYPAAVGVQLISHARNASTAQQRQPTAFKPASPPSSQTSSLNPPSSTLPPTLETVVRGPEQSQPSYLFALGKAYLNFYKTGVKAVWNNGKAATAVRQTKLRGMSVTAGVESGAITRGEWLLLLRTAADWRRVPLFALLLAVCGEFTPLVVVFASPLVPWTCRIPKQVAHERARRQERRRLSVHDIGRERLAANLHFPVHDANNADANASANVAAQLQSLSREQLLHLGRALALYGRTWDLLGGFPRPLLRARIRRHLEHLALDDALLRQGGGPDRLVDEELRVACEDRALDVLDATGKDKDPAALRQSLHRWLQDARQKPMVELLLVQ